MEIRAYTAYNEAEILPLYAQVGWTAYTQDPSALEQGFRHSLLVLAAYEQDALLGLIRVVGDGATVVLVQDLLGYPDKPRQGIGTALLKAVWNVIPPSGRSSWSPTTRRRPSRFIARSAFPTLRRLAAAGL